MKRPLIISIALAATVSAAFALATHRWWDAALHEGKSLHGLRPLEKRAKRARPNLPLVVWVGDSTIMNTRRFGSYPGEIRDRLVAVRKPIESVQMAYAGIGPFQEYCIVGKIVPLAPDALYIVANLNALTRTGNERGILEVASFIPPDELFRASFLPWHFANITVPRLHLARSLTWPWVERLVHFTEGLRQLFRDRLYSSPQKLPLRQQILANQKRMKRFSVPIDARSPQVVMLRATVDLAVRRNIPTTVILTPIHPRVVELNDPSGRMFAERSAMLKRVVESAGGRYVDLHDALPEREFRDLAGHFNTDGTAHMATLLARFVRHDTFGTPQLPSEPHRPRH